MRKKLSQILFFVVAILFLFSYVNATEIQTNNPAILPADLTPSHTGPTGGKIILPLEPPIEGSIPISTRNQLRSIDNFLTGNFHLVNDIDLSGTEWLPIGDAHNAFTGIFDGQGYVIRGMTITGNQTHVGLFARTDSAIIKNLGLSDTNINIYQGRYVGGIVGMCIGGIVSNVFNTGNVVGGYSVGGIVGIRQPRHWTENIRYSYNTASVSLIGTGGYAGGIVGTDYNYVENCFNIGDISATVDIFSYANVGGIVGKGTVRDSHNAGNVSAFFDNTTNYDSSFLFVGGVIGVGYAPIGESVIVAFNSYNTGDVSAVSVSHANAGGIVGRIESSHRNRVDIVVNCHNKGAIFSSQNAGGIVGSSHNANINNCYNMGYVHGDDNAGGINGLVSGANIGDSFNMGAIHGNNNSGGIFGSTTHNNNRNSSIINVYNMGDIFSHNGRAGGIGGYSDIVPVENTYNGGRVRGATHVGGIMGQHDDPSFVQRCYFNLDSIHEVAGVLQNPRMGIGLSSRDTPVGLTTAEMKQQFSFLGFDFNTVWAIDENINGGFPYLRSLPPTDLPIDLTPLINLIEQAESLLQNTRISPDGRNVPAGYYWATQEAHNALRNAITEARRHIN